MSGTLLRLALALLLLVLIGMSISTWRSASTPLESPEAPVSTQGLSSSTELSLERPASESTTDVAAPSVAREAVAEQPTVDERESFLHALSGIVRWPDGTPAPGTLVEAHRRMLAHVSRDSLSMETTTDDEGRFAIEALPENDYLSVV